MGRTFTNLHVRKLKDRSSDTLCGGSHSPLWETELRTVGPGDVEKLKADAHPCGRCLRSIKASTKATAKASVKASAKAAAKSASPRVAKSAKPAKAVKAIKVTKPAKAATVKASAKKAKPVVAKAKSKKATKSAKSVKLTDKPSTDVTANEPDVSVDEGFGFATDQV